MPGVGAIHFINGAFTGSLFGHTRMTTALRDRLTHRCHSFRVRARSAAAKTRTAAGHVLTQA